LGQIPDSVILSIARNIVYLSAVGRKDLGGDDWGDIFAAAVNGIHRKSSLGIDDITLGTTAWSAKTVKARNAVAESQVRLISGRNNVRYSFGNNDVFADIQTTGRQVLDIWNRRVEEATQSHPQLRTVVLIRNMTSFHFKVFEQPTAQFDPAEYTWRRNEEGNIEGYTIVGEVHAFTWQPNGGQFTILQQVRGSARPFQIRKPDPVDQEEILNNLGYSEDWVTLLGPRLIGLEITSRPANGDAYISGEIVTISVRFGDTVIVTGSPQVKLGIGKGDHHANYVSGSGASQLTFQYTTVPGDRDSRGIGIPKDSILLNGGTIGYANDRDSVIMHRAVKKNVAHKVRAV
jgi:hypothetical protein